MLILKSYKFMPKQEKISIITTSFQSECTIKDTLESVNNQSYASIDHIIIDGGSKDGTLALVKEYGNRVTHITSEQDKGIFDAYNKGLAIADGEIIGILNSDDFYSNDNVIEKVMRYFDDPSVDAVYADLVYVDKFDTNHIVRHWKSKPYNKGDFARSFSPAHPTLFLRRSFYNLTGGFNQEFNLAGDYEYMLRAFHVHNARSRYIPDTLVKMRTGGATGGTMSFIKKQNKQILRALEVHGVSIFKPIFFTRKFVNRLTQHLRGAFLHIQGKIL